MARILFWSSAYWPHIGGVEILGEKLVAALSALGHEFVVITDARPGDIPNECHNGVNIYRLPMVDAFHSSNIERWVEMRTAVSRIKREFKPQLVWNYQVQVDCMFHLMTQSSHSAPTLATVHSEYHDVEVTPRSSVRDLMKTAAWVTACSSQTLDAVKRRVPEIGENSSVVANALTMPTLLPTPLSFHPPTILCLGRIQDTTEKGFDLAIDAMPAILQKFPTAILVIGGDGAGRKPLEAHAAELGVAHRVRFMGWVAPDDVPALINDATIVLMPSRVQEGFGLVALQAQQMARPVVAARAGGLVNVVVDGETGILVERTNSAAIAEAILALLSHSEHAAAIGRAGRIHVQQRFSFDQHVNAYDSMIKRLTASVQSATAIT